MLLYIKLYYEFCKIGFFTVGGGLATIPFLESLSNKTNWFTEKDLVNMLAISESTPGAIGINMATYTGYLTGGPLGGIVATLGIVTPSVLIILVISKALKKFKENTYINGAFYGLRPASVGLITAATFGIIKVSFLYSSKHLSFFQNLNIKSLILGIILYILIKKIKINPILLIVCSGVVGVIFKI
ncbi:chromate transporter [uncultured Cetobacterium sp.]|uniref:chromate transporter n=1 Tax=uncultured Cetobacterium sp. TaxID=527638 RepID=UPI002606EFC4|nr:chromate transporter [uncultured Cetobacterium sp.]